MLCVGNYKTHTCCRIHKVEAVVEKIMLITETLQVVVCCSAIRPYRSTKKAMMAYEKLQCTRITLGDYMQRQPWGAILYGDYTGDPSLSQNSARVVLKA